MRAQLGKNNTGLEWLNGVLCVKRQVVFSPSALQWQDGNTEPCLTWNRMEFHRCLKIVVRSKEMLTASVVWHWESLQLRLDYTLLTNKPHVPSLGSGRTNQWKNSCCKLNTTARCIRFRSSVVQKNISELTTRDMICRKTEAQQTNGTFDDGDIVCHPMLVLSYLQTFDTANVKIGTERNPQKTEVIHYLPDLDAAPPERRVKGALRSE